MTRFVASIVAIAFLAAAAPAATAPALATQDHDASWLVALGSPGPLMSGGLCYGELLSVPYSELGEGIWYGRMDVDPRTWGAPFTVTFDTETGFSSPYLAGVVGVTFYDAGGEATGQAAAGGYERTIGEARIAAGSVPSQTTAALFWACEEIGPFTAAYHAEGHA